MTDATNPDSTINSAIAVANWFIKMNHDDPSELTHLKLHKLLYFAQGWRLAYFNFPLFEDPIEAWKYGPVVSSVYFALSSRKKKGVITDMIRGYFARGADYSLGTPEMEFHNDDIGDFMMSVWNSYSKKSAWELVATTHAKGSPWEKVANLSDSAEGDTDTEWYLGYVDRVIPVELMRAYFKSFLPGDN
ncbi:MAG: DUF4065 domain-containing protein [Deltaproteobacteria bacterium]|jgi:uncharacterized phage-associated protein|nr:DUF4065 domain-containing protein [Deltaproteobacteria bacterium]